MLPPRGSVLQGSSPGPGRSGRVQAWVFCPQPSPERVCHVLRSHDGGQQICTVVPGGSDLLITSLFMTFSAVSGLSRL